jgi:hypothetical protein
VHKKKEYNLGVAEAEKRRARYIKNGDNFDAFKVWLKRGGFFCGCWVQAFEVGNRKRIMSYYLSERGV